jgi:hypothetical protein
MGSLDHLIRPDENELRNYEPERLRGLQVDHPLEPSWADERASRRGPKTVWPSGTHRFPEGRIYLRTIENPLPPSLTGRPWSTSSSPLRLPETSEWRDRTAPEQPRQDDSSPYSSYGQTASNLVMNLRGFGLPSRGTPCPPGGADHEAAGFHPASCRRIPPRKVRRDFHPREKRPAPFLQGILGAAPFSPVKPHNVGEPSEPQIPLWKTVDPGAKMRR